MFRVIVAGGIALSATTPALVMGCGGSTSTPSDAGHLPTDGFPAETAQSDAFALTDGGSDARALDSSMDQDAFPQEGPNIEAGYLDSGGSDAEPDNG